MEKQKLELKDCTFRPNIQESNSKYKKLKSKDRISDVQYMTTQ